MALTDKSINSFDLNSRVKQLIRARVSKVFSSRWYSLEAETFCSGKLLRTNFAAKLIDDTLCPVNPDTLVHTCAATELVHTASICHDDVIDNGLIRRGLPSLWRNTGPSSAILLGDLLFCEALNLLVESVNGRYVKIFIAKIQEVCSSEIEQEILLRGKQLNETTCLRISRGKTGSLFAFVGYVCGGDNNALSLALEEAGYRIGTAYQLADDLLDLIGDEKEAGKTLNCDFKRKKYTLPQFYIKEQDRVYEIISDQCMSALQCVDKWPKYYHALGRFIDEDLQKAFKLIGIV